MDKFYNKNLNEIYEYFDSSSNGLSNDKVEKNKKRFWQINIEFILNLLYYIIYTYVFLCDVVFFAKNTRPFA